ncbi:preprotein translocase subunit SecG [Candidatus Saccharibacteria bacterium]|jgi:preprotein translocase subunit SecG|nr:preprotein translocase subunit SecG [Candidatus Saccharibacteria bacterium]MCR4753532.1 preprotein translocase subunit SecG [Candidatus Saccharibacteria bacterium]
MDIGVFLNVMIFASAILLILLILLQQRGASLGAGFGGSGELNTERRGLEKSLFNATIVFVVIFVLSILAILIV